MEGHRLLSAQPVFAAPLSKKVIFGVLPPMASRENLRLHQAGVQAATIFL
jgi:hypothetical protein